MWMLSFARLLTRALLSTPSLLSSNWLATLVSLVTFSVPQLGKWGEHEWKLAYMREHWKENLKIGSWTVVSVWLGLFAISIGKSIYDDHQSLIHRIQNLTQQNRQLRVANSQLVDPKGKDSEIAQFKIQVEDLKKTINGLQSPEVRAFPVAPAQRPGVAKMEYALTTGKIRTPAELTSSCDFPITTMTVTPLTASGGSTSSTTDERISATQYKVTIFSPAWSPQVPLWVTIFFEGTVNRMPSCKFSAQ